MSTFRKNNQSKNNQNIEISSRMRQLRVSYSSAKIDFDLAAK